CGRSLSSRGNRWLLEKLIAHQENHRLSSSVCLVIRYPASLLSCYSYDLSFSVCSVCKMLLCRLAPCVPILSGPRLIAVMNSCVQKSMHKADWICSRIKVQAC